MIQGKVFSDAKKWGKEPWQSFRSVDEAFVNMLAENSYIEIGIVFYIIFQILLI